MARPTRLELVRFGFGPGADDDPADGPPDAARLMAQLAPAPPPVATPSTAERQVILTRARADREAAKKGLGPKVTDATEAQRQLVQTDLRAWIANPVVAPNGFAERLVYFWSNRLTVAFRPNDTQSFLMAYVDDAIRPHVGGRFAAMLAASAWHPAMLSYLDQVSSVGPNSVVGKKRRAGLNENFAREFLELHSMGSGYTQADVTELARLFTGMTFHRETGAGFDPRRAEPGAKTVLGARYDGGSGDIGRLIETVARRPETARHIATALARHFLAPEPPPDAVDAMARAYLDHDTALPPVYAAMLAHPAAADPVLQNLRSPVEFMAATARALAVPIEADKLKPGEALRAMGQHPFRPRGPDGWPDTPEGWISGPYLSARLKWAERLARRFDMGRDPRALARAMLGPADEATRIAVAQAEQRWEGVAVLLSSPAFMRR